MALKSIRSILFFSFIFILLTTSIPGGAVQALGSSEVRLPELAVFVSQVRNGQPDDLRGVYVPDVLAARIVQQPAGNESFVSPRQKTVTQFALASQFGSTGLLAHNYLAGESFALLSEGREFYLVYGDGRVSTFVVTEILRYQALQPTNTQSEFVSLDGGSLRTAADVFAEVYNRPGQVIFQTCISDGKNSSWGRLFVIAESYYNKKYSPNLTPTNP